MAWGIVKLLYEGNLQFDASLGSNKEQKKEKRQIQ